MLYTTPPTRLAIPFANAGGKNTVPDASQIGITDGAASFTDGFPPLTRTRIDQGGIPPHGLDMNGVLYQMSAPVRYLQAGGGYTYDSTFAATIGGYPKGARLLGSDGASCWKAGADSITSNPESTGSAAAGWVPGFVNSGISINVSSTGDFALSPVQYNNSLIVFTGAIVGTRIITMPTIMSAEWTIQSDVTVGDVTVKTAAGAGVTISPGSRLKIYCDGVNIKSSVITRVEDPSFSNASDRPAAASWVNSGFFRKSGGTVTGDVIAPQLIVKGTLGDVILGAIDTTRGVWLRDAAGTYQDFLISRTANGQARIPTVLDTKEINSDTIVRVRNVSSQHTSALMATTDGAGSYLALQCRDSTDTTRMVPVLARLNADGTPAGLLLGQFATGITLGVSPAAGAVANEAATASWVNAKIASDRRLKSNLQPVGSTLDRLAGITAYTYDMQGFAGRKLGSIAQDWQAAFPEAVSHITWDDGKPAIGIEPLSAIAVLVEAVNELSERVKALESEK